MPPETPFDSKDFATLTSDLLQSLATATGAPLTDDNEGSVVRTLAEAFARELAVCYQQLRKVYQHGFLDTAEGVALDHVVALLGMNRQRAGHLEGLVTFRRPQPAPADIPVPSGTLVSGRGAPVCATVEDSLLARGEQEVSVRVRSLEPGGQAVRPGALNLMPRPIWGVDTVVNHADLLLRQSEESDDELRERARRLLLETVVGTPAAIAQAVRTLGIAQVQVHEDPRRPGTIEVVLGDHDIDDALLEQAKTVVENVRTAGIQVSVQRSQQVVIEIAAMLVLHEDFPEQRREAVLAQIKRSLQSYFDSLGSGARVRWSKVSSLLTAPDEVNELRSSADGSVYPRPFVKQDGKWQDVSASHTLRNGDIDIGTHERAALDLGVKPLRVVLEPPLLEVWVEVSLGSPLNPREEQVWLAWLKAQFDTFKAPRTVTWDDLVATLPPGSTGVVTAFTLKHQPGGEPKSLHVEGDSDQLGQRERLLVGQIDYPGKSHG
ncbi:MAG: baseplate J/gp47 family protein [Candidatus Accumulibacter sp.]|nr:baseplate J/gp47 family protein [Accumulibacter sp.]